MKGEEKRENCMKIAKGEQKVKQKQDKIDEKEIRDRRKSMR